MTTRLTLFLILQCLWLIHAQAELPAEQYTVETLPFPPDPHRLYIVDAEFDNLVTSRVTIIDPDQQRYLGMISAGFIAPTVLSADNKTIYTADVFYSRGVRGERTDVLTAYSTTTLSPEWEVLIPAKRLNSLGERFQFNLTNDDRFALISNFTPAASVSVVDVQQRKFIGEIDISGCMLNYPAGERRFMSICGDGSLLIITLDDQGLESDRQRLDFFDPKQDLVVERAVVKDGIYYFTSFNGKLYSVNVRNKNIKIGKPWSLLSEKEYNEGWRTGGWQLIALSPRDDLLFALVHPDAYNGSHKDPSNTIWVYDLITRKKVNALTSETPIWSIHASNDDNALLFGLNIEGGLEIFDVKTAQHKATMKGIAKTATYMLTH